MAAMAAYKGGFQRQHDEATTHSPAGAAASTYIAWDTVRATRPTGPPRYIHQRHGLTWATVTDNVPSAFRSFLRGGSRLCFALCVAWLSTRVAGQSWWILLMFCSLRGMAVIGRRAGPQENPGISWGPALRPPGSGGRQANRSS